MHIKSIGLFIFLAILLPSLSASETKNNILYINSYHTGFTWSDNIETAFSKELFKEKLDTHNEPYNLFIERMDSKRLPISHITPLFYHLIKGKYSTDFFDAVVTSDDNAFNFANKYRDELFPNTPIIFSGVNNKESPFLTKGYSNTGVLEDVDISGVLALIMFVHPKTRHIALIGDMTSSADIHINNTKNVLNKKYPNLTYSTYKKWTLDSLEDELKKLKENSVIIELAFHMDKNGVLIDFEEERDFLLHKTSLPAYSLWDNRLDYGILGGVITSGAIHGEMAASLVKSKLKDEFINNPIRENITYPVYFDYNLMKRFDIKENMLPKSALILNKPETLWFEYKKYIITVVIFSIAQILLIILLIINIHKKQAAQKELLQFYQGLEDEVKLRTQDLNESLENLKMMQKNPIENEKMASLGSLVVGVAHKINTPIGVCITAASYMKDIIRRPENVELLEPFTLLESNIEEVANIITNFRQISVSFSTEDPEEINLSDYINQIIQLNKSSLDEVGVGVSCICDKKIIITTYARVIQKVFSILINNSLMHGFDETIDKPTIEIQALRNREEITLLYWDNGHGLQIQDKNRIFDPFYTTKLAMGNGGLGLSIVYNEIIHRLKGNIEIDNSRSIGLGLKINIPSTSIDPHQVK